MDQLAIGQWCYQFYTMTLGLSNFGSEFSRQVSGKCTLGTIFIPIESVGATNLVVRNSQYMKDGRLDKSPLHLIYIDKDFAAHIQLIHHSPNFRLSPRVLPGLNGLGFGGVQACDV